MKTFIVKSESFIEQELVNAKEILDYDGDLILRQANQLAQEGYITTFRRESPCLQVWG